MAEQTVTIKTFKTAGSSQSGASFVIDTSQLKEIGKRLRAADPALAKTLRLRLRALGQVVADEAKEQADFSTRIPGSIRVRVSGFSVKIVANADGTAPDAAPLEHNGVAGKFRHPVFGDRSVWVEQDARPFLAPALESKADLVEVAATSIIDDTLREVGIL
jgi:hypothetical protein